MLDNLSTGFDWAIAEGVPLVVGETGDQALVAKLIKEHGVEAIIHFAASIVVPDSVADPLGYYKNNTVNSRALIECAVKGGVKHFIFSSTAAVYGNTDARAGDRGRSARPDVALRLVQADDRDHAARRERRARARACHPALFQRRGRRPRAAHRTIHQGRDASHQGRGRGRARPARQDRGVRHRLSDAGRHLRARLHPCERSRAGASRRAALSARRRRVRRR